MFNMLNKLLCKMFCRLNVFDYISTRIVIEKMEITKIIIF